MTRFLLSLGAIALALAIGEPVRADDVASPAERWIGTWSGKATWKGCSLDTPGKLALDIAMIGGALSSDGDTLIDGLGDLAWTTNGDALALTREGGLEVSLTPGKKGAKLVVKTSAGCVGKATLKRTTSGMTSCDTVRALSTVKASCDGLPAESRGDDLADVQASWKKWSKLKGKKKTAQGKKCTAQVDALRTELASCPTGGSVAGRTGIPGCDEYIRVTEHFIQCSSVPQASRDAVKQGLDAMTYAWGDMSGAPEEARKAADDACRQATDGLRQGAAAMGCSLP